MGLDNGIVIKDIDKIDLIIPKKIRNTYYLRGEVAYWRKCWGIREAILNVLNSTGASWEEWEFEVNREQLKNIIVEMKKFTKRKYWEQYADSIWEYDEFKYNQKRNIKALKWLYKCMGKNPEIEVYFYDSY